MANGPRIMPALVSLLLCAAAAMAAPTAPRAAAGPTAPPVDSKSKAVLERMCTFLAAAPAFSVAARPDATLADIYSKMLERYEKLERKVATV